jgi:tripartite-type tricarboxylate transporter receptor subunit TctC
MRINRRQFTARILAASAAASVFPSHAQRGTVRLFVGFPPGGLPDQVARAVAEQMRRAMDVPVVVENRPGANGRIAGQAVKAAAADGFTYWVAPASNIVHLPHVYSDLGYDVLTDFAPVAQVVENDFAFAISAKVPATTLKEFAEWCGKNPDKAAFGSAGAGSTPHLMGLMVAKALGVKLLHVPYKGSTLVLNDLTGGHLSGIVSVTSSVTRQHKAGSVRILATTSRTRSVVLPQVPTFAELGMGELTLTEGTWVLAPARTPQTMIEKASIAAMEAAGSRELPAVIEGQTIAAPLGPIELRQLLQSEFARRGAMVKSIGFSAGSS